MPCVSRRLTAATCPFILCAWKSKSSAAPRTFRIASAKSVSARLLMDQLLYYIARGLIAFLQALPLDLGGAHWPGRRRAGLLVRCPASPRRHQEFDHVLRHGKVARGNPRARARKISGASAKTFACAVKTASMTFDQLSTTWRSWAAKSFCRKAPTEPHTSRVFAIGHFGNFELFAHSVQILPRVSGRHHLPRLRTPRH